MSTLATPQVSAYCKRLNLDRNLLTLKIDAHLMHIIFFPCFSFVEEPEVVTVAALRRNAGAGGAMVAAAADYVISNPSVILNNSYKVQYLAM